ncbi:hypothetical protein HN873_039868 [Arachis hypogaea]
MSVLWLGPLLVIAMIILINTLFSLCYLIVRWKSEFERFWSCGFISSQFISFLWKQLEEGSSRIPSSSKVSTGSFKIVAIDEDKQTDKDRWKGLAYDISNDQQDITRGKGIL